MDGAKRDAAIAFARARETNWPRDFSTQEKVFGSLLGPMPTARAGSNTIFVSPDHDLVIVWRRHGADKEAFFRQSLTPSSRRRPDDSRLIRQ
jgi:hypothetical protein